MVKSAVDRQLAAVDSEFDLRRDAFCIELIQKTALLEKNHPQSHFTAGNRKSLTTFPKAEHNVDAYETLKQWYKRNYCSKWMKLVLQANLPLGKKVNHFLGTAGYSLFISA